MKSVDDVFSLLGGVTVVGRIIGKRAEHAGVMKTRGSIPVSYWPALIAAAKKYGVPEITSDSVMRAHVKARLKQNA